MSGPNIFRVVAVGLLLSWMGWILGEQYTWKKPEIAGYEWSTNWVSGTLYSPDHRKAASVVMAGSTPAQVCIFDDNVPRGLQDCFHFAKTQAAFDFVGDVYRKGEK